MNLVAIGLAVATLVAAAVRTALSFRDLRNLAETRRQALTDDLTGLPNRRAFSKNLERVFAPSPARAGTGARRAMLLIDLDQFKEVNDTLGHHIRDDLLGLIGPRLAAAVGPGAMLARLGGDEFGVLLEEGSDSEAGVTIAKAVADALAEPFLLEGITVRLGASVGIAVAPDDGIDGHAILERADVAMYQAKHARCGYRLYAPDQDGHSRDRLALVDELRVAIDNGDLDVYYQPKAEFATGRITGAEALVRWQHPTSGFLGPDTFIPVAEQSGLMRPLTALVLDRALRQHGEWKRSGLELTVAVNLSASNLLDSELPAEVADLLERLAVPASVLCLEITENHIMGDPVRAHEVLAALRLLGVRIAIDDFGTGYSSLAYLRTLSVDEIKVDKSFVMHMHEQPDDVTVVRATIELAHALGLQVTAEGVETPQAWEMLRSFGAEAAQGYLLSRPVPAEELTNMLQSYHASEHGPAPRTLKYA